MADRDIWDERAEKMLWCPCPDNTAYGQKITHIFSCPSYYWEAVAAALRELAFIADVETKKRQALSERLRAELAAAQRERDAARAELCANATAAQGQIEKKAEKLAAARVMELVAELAAARAELERLKGEERYKSELMRKVLDLRARCSALDKQLAATRAELEAVREAAREVIAQYQYKATPPEYPLKNRAVLFLERRPGRREGGMMALFEFLIFWFVFWPLSIIGLTVILRSL